MLREEVPSDVRSQNNISEWLEQTGKQANIKKLPQTNCIWQDFF